MNTSSPTPPDNDTLDPATAREQANRALGYHIPRSTWYRLIACGSIDTIRIGAKVRISRNQLAEFVARCKEGRRW